MRQSTKPITWRLESLTNEELIGVAWERLHKHHVRSTLRFKLWMRLRSNVKTIKYSRSKMFADWYAAEALDILAERIK